MKIIEPSYTILKLDPAFDVFALIELAGRTCYKSEDKINNNRPQYYNFEKKIFITEDIEDTSAYNFPNKNKKPVSGNKPKNRDGQRRNNTTTTAQDQA